MIVSTPEIVFIVRIVPYMCSDYSSELNCSAANFLARSFDSLFSMLLQRLGKAFMEAGAASSAAVGLGWSERHSDASSHGQGTRVVKISDVR